MDKKVVATASECVEPTEDEEPENETREERFRRIAKRRVTRTLKEISLIGNLTGQNYKFTEAEVSAMFLALDDALDATRAAFERVLAHAARDKVNFDF